MNIRHRASVYFALQGAAVVLWWIWLFSIPSSRSYFRMGDSDAVLLAFWLPDLLLLAGGSLAASAFCFFGSRFAPSALWFAAGVAGYATFYCLSFALMTDTGWLGFALMFPAMILSGNFAVALSPPIEKLMFRRSAEAATGWILTKTFAQIVVVWSLILLVFPWLIVRLEDKLGVARFQFPAQKPLAMVLFGLLSLLGVSGAYTMARIGRGTPLPMDTASRLVVRGIYAYVRNPMAISGIGQGLAVGLFLGSPLVLVYALLGGLVWQLVFRPLEEADLAKNFGADYESYRGTVKCWIPRVKPYQIEATADSSNSISSPSGKI
jgi:protein-S-isoprenylcysteine O-methyltransferase Ste14